MTDKWVASQEVNLQSLINLDRQLAKLWWWCQCQELANCWTVSYSPRL